jgi:hypothetical protein
LLLPLPALVSDALLLLLPLTFLCTRTFLNVSLPPSMSDMVGCWGGSATRHSC